MLHQESFVGFVVQPSAAGVHASPAHRYVECAGKVIADALSSSQRFNGSGFDQSRNSGTHGLGEGKVSANGIEGEEIVRRAIEHIDRKRAALGLPEYDASKWGRSGDTRMKELLDLPIEERIQAAYGVREAAD